MKKLIAFMFFGFLGIYFLSENLNQSQIVSRKKYDQDMGQETKQRVHSEGRSIANTDLDKKGISMALSEKEWVRAEELKKQRKKSKIAEVIAKNKPMKLDLMNSYQNSLQEGISLRGNQYILAEDVFALKKDEVLPYDFPILEEKFGAYLVYVEDGVRPDGAYEVVYNKSSNRFAIFTGVLRATFKEGATDWAATFVDDVAAASNLFVSYEFSDSEMYLKKGKYTFDSYSEAKAIYKFAQNLEQYEANIEKMGLELVENQRNTN